MFVTAPSTPPHHPGWLWSRGYSEPVFGGNPLWLVIVASDSADLCGEIGIRRIEPSFNRSCTNHHQFTDCEDKNADNRRTKQRTDHAVADDNSHPTDDTRKRSKCSCCCRSDLDWRVVRLPHQDSGSVSYKLETDGRSLFHRLKPRRPLISHAVSLSERIRSHTEYQSSYPTPQQRRTAPPIRGGHRSRAGHAE